MRTPETSFAFARRARPYLGGAALALFLSACSLAPTYERPAAPVADGFPGGGQEQASLVAWREFFLDARLQALVELALANNRDLRIAVQRVEEARAQYGIADSERLPTLGIQGTEQAAHTPANMRGANTSSVSRSFSAGAGFMSFELDFFGRVRNLSAAAFEQYLSTEQARRTVQLSLVAQTAEAYFRMRAAEALKALMDQTLEARQGTLDLVKVRFDVGVASDLDLAQAQGQLDVVRADRIAAERDLAMATNALGLILGTAIPDNLPEPLTYGRDQLIADLPAGLPSQLLERRPDIVGAEHALRAANAQIGAARAAFFPNISLTSVLGFASPELGGLFSGSQRTWQFAPQIVMPIFSGGIRGGLDLAVARNNIAVANYEKTVQVAFREVADGLAGEATYGRQIEAMRDTENTALKTLQLAQVRYETGIDSFLQVQSAQVNLYTVQQQFIGLGTQALLNRLALFKALGGGWTESDATLVPAPKEIGLWN